MLEALEYTFVQHAILAALLVSIISGLIGSLIVVNRMVFLTGGIAHASYAGIGIAIFFALPMLLTTTFTAAFFALFMAYFTMYDRSKNDYFISTIWAVGMAIGIILVDLTPGYAADMMSYLFGSILAVNIHDLYFMALLVTVSFAIIVVKYRQILAVSYDREYAKLLGINVPFYYTLILLLAALSIVITMKVVGLILIIAMLTIPIYIAELFSRSLWQMMLFAVLLCIIFTLAGLAVSYQYDFASGPAIIMIAAISLLCVQLFIRRRA